MDTPGILEKAFKFKTILEKTDSLSFGSNSESLDIKNILKAAKPLAQTSKRHIYIEKWLNLKNNLLNLTHQNNLS